MVGRCCQQVLIAKKMVHRSAGWRLTDRLDSINSNHQPTNRVAKKDFVERGCRQQEGEPKPTLLCLVDAVSVPGPGWAGTAGRSLP